MYNTPISVFTEAPSLMILDLDFDNNRCDSAGKWYNAPTHCHSPPLSLFHSFIISHSPTHTYTHLLLVRSNACMDRFPHMCTCTQSPTPRPHTALHYAWLDLPLNSHRDSKNTHEEEIPTFHRNGPVLQRHPNNKPLPTRNHPRQYRKSQASEGCFSRMVCCV